MVEKAIKLAHVVLLISLMLGCTLLADLGVGSMLSNGKFSQGLQHWSHGFSNGTTGTIEVVDRHLRVEVSSLGDPDSISNFRVHQGGLNLEAGQRYILEFDAWAESTREIGISVWENGNDLDGNGFGWSPHSTNRFSLSSTRNRYSHEFTMDITNTDAGLAFFVGQSLIPVHIDDVFFAAAE